MAMYKVVKQHRAMGQVFRRMSEERVNVLKLGQAGYLLAIIPPSVLALSKQTREPWWQETDNPLRVEHKRNLLNMREVQDRHTATSSSSSSSYCQSRSLQLPRDLRPQRTMSSAQQASPTLDMFQKEVPPNRRVAPEPQMGWVLPVRGVVTLLVLLTTLLLTKPVSSGSCWLFKPIDSLTGHGPLRING